MAKKVEIDSILEALASRLQSKETPGKAIAAVAKEIKVPKDVVSGAYNNPKNFMKSSTWQKYYADRAAVKRHNEKVAKSGYLKDERAIPFPSSGAKGIAFNSRHEMPRRPVTPAEEARIKRAEERKELAAAEKREKERLAKIKDIRSKLTPSARKEIKREKDRIRASHPDTPTGRHNARLQTSKVTRKVLESRETRLKNLTKARGERREVRQREADRRAGLSPAARLAEDRRNAAIARLEERRRIQEAKEKITPEVRKEAEAIRRSGQGGRGVVRRAIENVSSRDAIAAEKRRARAERTTRIKSYVTAIRDPLTRRIFNDFMRTTPGSDPKRAITYAIGEAAIIRSPRGVREGEGILRSRASARERRTSPAQQVVNRAMEARTAEARGIAKIEYDEIKPKILERISDPARRAKMDAAFERAQARNEERAMRQATAAHENRKAEYASNLTGHRAGFRAFMDKMGDPTISAKEKIDVAKKYGIPATKLEDIKPIIAEAQKATGYKTYGRGELQKDPRYQQAIAAGMSPKEAATLTKIQDGIDRGKDGPQHARAREIIAGGMSPIDAARQAKTESYANDKGGEEKIRKGIGKNLTEIFNAGKSVYTPPGPAPTIDSVRKGMALKPKGKIKPLSGAAAAAGARRGAGIIAGQTYKLGVTTGRDPREVRATRAEARQKMMERMREAIVDVAKTTIIPKGNFTGKDIAGQKRAYIEKETERIRNSIPITRKGLEDAYNRYASLNPKDVPPEGVKGTLRESKGRKSASGDTFASRIGERLGGAKGLFPGTYGTKVDGKPGEVNFEGARSRFKGIPTFDEIFKTATADVDQFAVGGARPIGDVRGVDPAIIGAPIGPAGISAENPITQGQTKEQKRREKARNALSGGGTKQLPAKAGGPTIGDSAFAKDPVGVAAKLIPGFDPNNTGHVRMAREAAKSGTPIDQLAINIKEDPSARIRNFVKGMTPEDAQKYGIKAQHGTRAAGIEAYSKILRGDPNDPTTKRMLKDIENPGAGIRRVQGSEASAAGAPEASRSRARKPSSGAVTSSGPTKAMHAFVENANAIGGMIQNNYGVSTVQEALKQISDPSTKIGQAFAESQSSGKKEAQGLGGHKKASERYTAHEAEKARRAAEKVPTLPSAKNGKFGPRDIAQTLGMSNPLRQGGFGSSMLYGGRITPSEITQKILEASDPMYGKAIPNSKITPREIARQQQVAEAIAGNRGKLTDYVASALDSKRGPDKYAKDLLSTLAKHPEGKVMASNIFGDRADEIMSKFAAQQAKSADKPAATKKAKGGTARREVPQIPVGTLGPPGRGFGAVVNPRGATPPAAPPPGGGDEKKPKDAGAGTPEQVQAARDKVAAGLIAKGVPPDRAAELAKGMVPDGATAEQRSRAYKNIGRVAGLDQKNPAAAAGAVKGMHGGAAAPEAGAKKKGGYDYKQHIKKTDAAPEKPAAKQQAKSKTKGGAKKKDAPAAPTAPAAKPKAAPKPAAKPAEEKKKETARKTAEKKSEQSRKQQDRQGAAAPKPRPIKPMSQKDQRQELIKASGYTKGSGAANAYESILKKGVDPETARGIVEDGRKSGIKGQQLEKYANSRQKGADHDVAKASATPKKPASVRAASSSSSSGNGRRGGGTSRGTRSGGGSPGRRLPSGMGAVGGAAGGGKIMGSTSASAFGADRGIVGAARNSIGQITQSLLTAQVIQRVGSLIQQITGGLIGFNMKLEESSVAFKTLFINEQRTMGTFFGDTQEATAKAAILTKQIQDFANVTPFRFGELVTAAERMKAFGFETREILPSLRGIGDAVAALGGEDDKLRRITYALGQMKQAGRVYQNDMMQLSNAGIAGYEILAKGLITEFVKTGKVMLEENGKIYKYNADDINVVVNDLIKNQGKGAYQVASAQSERFNQIFERIFTDPVEAIRQFTKRGNIDGKAAARVIIAGLEQTYRGGMDQLSRTMQGSISTVQDTSQFIIASSFKPIYDELRNALYSAGQFMMGPGAARMAKGIAAAIEPIGQTMTKVIPEAISAFGSFVAMIAKASSNASKSIASIQIGARSLADYIKGTIGAGIKSIVDLIKTDFGQAAITATFAIATISKVVTANPIVIGLVAIVGAFGAITESMQNVLKLGMPTAQAFATLSKEEQETARAGFEVREAFADMGRTIRRVKQDMGPTLGKILTSISKILAKVGSQGIKVTVQAIEQFIKVATAIMQKIEPFSGEIAAILVAFLSFKVANQGITKLTSIMNALAMSITSVAGAAVLIRSGGILAVIRGAIGGNISNTAINAAIPAAKGARGAKAAATGAGAGLKEIAQTQIRAFETGTKARPITLGSATSAVGDLLSTIFGVGGKAAKKKTQLRGPDGRFIKGVAQAGAELSKFGKTASVVISIVSKVGRFFLAAGRFIAVWIIIVPAIIDNIGPLVRMIGSFVGMIGRMINAIGKVDFSGILGPIKSLLDIIDGLQKAISYSVGKIAGFMTYLFDRMFPETDAERATREIALYNQEIARIIEIGMSVPDASKIAQYTVDVQRQMEDMRTQLENSLYMDDVINAAYGNQGNNASWIAGLIGIPEGGIDWGLLLKPGTQPGEWVAPWDDNYVDPAQKALDEFMKTSTQYTEATVAAFGEILKVVDEYKQKLIEAGITEAQASAAAASIEAEIRGNIDAIMATALATGDYTAAIAALGKIGIDTSSRLGDITDAAKIAGIAIENLANGDTEVTIFDENGMMEQFTVFGRNAQMVRDIYGQMKSYTDQLQNDLVSTGIISQADAEAQSKARMAEFLRRLGQATDGYYAGADGVREYLGQTEALSRILKEMGYAVGIIDTGDLWIAQLEDEIDKAKTAAEKIKAKIDPIVDAIIKRIQMSAEDQFAERLKNATTLLEQQRDAEIDAINVRVNGINQTYGLLDREIKAQEKKNRVLQIEKAILDAKKNVATAAIGAYGENVDPIEAAQRRREAEIGITEATKNAELERSKLALDEQQTTVEAIQSIFDIRISIITDAIDAEKMAFQEAIDFLVEKIKNGEIKGTAAVKALQNAFTQFGIAVPRTVQSIASSGTTPIGNLFDQLAKSVDAYYNKLKRIKAIEDTLGSTVDTGTPTQDEIDESTRVNEQYAQIDRNQILSGMKVAIYEIMNRVASAAGYQIKTGIGTDGKPISANTIEARKTLYTEFGKATAAIPKSGTPSQKDIDAFQAAVTKFVGYLQRPSVDLYSAQPHYGGGRAKGGPVGANRQYLVGEKGPELLTIGRGSGQVISNLYVKKLTDAFKSFRIGNPAIMPKMAYNMGGGGKAEFSVTINNPQVRTDSDIDKIVEAVNRSQMRMARRLGYS